MTDAALLVGRVLLGGLFFYNGMNHFRNLAAVSGYAAFKHVPAPRLATITSGAWLLATGLSIVLGVFPNAGALMAVVFLVVVTPIMHDFWAVGEGQRLGEFVNFQKNLGLLGAALMMLSIPSPWPYSLIP